MRGAGSALMLTIASMVGAVAPASAGAPGPVRLLVGLDDVSPARVAALASAAGVVEHDVAARARILVADVPGARAAAASAALEHLPGVRWVEPDRRLAPADLGIDDPFAGLQWALLNSGQVVSGVTGVAGVDLDLAGAWATTTGSPDVIVAVIDTGVDVDHPDLAANVWTNPGEVAGNGLDDDGNGLVDDVHGWDFQNGDATLLDDPAVDFHGTHVAGTIAAVANNAIGVSGVAPDATVLPLKFMGADGGWTSDAIAAIEYASAAGARIVNASWAGPSTSQALTDAIAAFDGVFVAAAGNETTDIDLIPSYPAASPGDNLVSVASIDSNGSLSAFSNYGATSVDLVAPGGLILNILPGGYGFSSGTSMAAPQVSAVLALMRSAAPGATTSQLVTALLGSVRPTAAADGVTVTGGALDAAAAVDAIVAATAPAPAPAPAPEPAPLPAPAPTPVVAPGPPRSLASAALNEQVTVSWLAPADPGTAAISGYHLTVEPGGVSVSLPASARDQRLIGLVNGTGYTVKVSAVSADGEGDAAAILVRAAPVAPDRVSGASRFATATAISRRTYPAGAGRVYVATARSFPDALAGAAAAAVQGAPVLLVERDSVPDDTAAELVRLEVSEVVVLGGAGAVSEPVAQQLGVLAGAPVRRLAGSSRYATAAAIGLHAFAPGVPVAYLVTGTSFADALGAGAAAAVEGGPVLLTAPTALPVEAAAALAALRPAKVVVIGGRGAVSDAVAAAAGAAAGAPVVRRSGPSRYATSAATTAATFDAGVPEVFIATGQGFPDALAGSAAAGALGLPVLLVPPVLPLPDEIAAELARLSPGRVVVLGGSGALPGEVVDAVQIAIQ